MAIAEFLEKSDKVKRVNYTGLASHPQADIIRRQQQGHTSLMSVELDASPDKAVEFIDNLKLLCHVANVGDARSMVIHPGTTTHSQLTDEQLRESGITPTTIRFSIGLETVDDIIADIDGALKAAYEA